MDRQATTAKGSGQASSKGGPPRKCKEEKRLAIGALWSIGLWPGCVETAGKGQTNSCGAMAKPNTASNNPNNNTAVKESNANVFHNPNEHVALDSVSKYKRN